MISYIFLTFQAYIYFKNKHSLSFAVQPLQVGEWESKTDYEQK